jgi:chemotaxis protein methyltransferase CheR
MDPSTFNQFRQIICDKSGISLSPGKEALLAARVGKRMRALNIPNYNTYLRFVLNDHSGEELVHLIDVISTNVTGFFREPTHFSFVGRLAAQWLARGRRRFRFWSAASSTGEEPYSLAMTLLETIGQQDVDLRILATDISTRVLQTCEAGLYSQEKIQSVPLPLRDRYFERERQDRETGYRAKPGLKQVITFRRLNLSVTPFPMQGPFDAIFCRNVMIYFDNRIRATLLDEIHRLLNPGGYLFVGHAESLTGLTSALKTVRPSIYVKS